MPNEITPYKKSAMVIKTERDLPKHISFEQYQTIYYSLEGTDQFLCGVLFETGARVSDVVSLRWNDIDTTHQKIDMFVDKRDINITIPISDPLNNDFKKILSWVKPSPEDFIFCSGERGPDSENGHLTRQGVGYKVKKWGDSIGIKLNPHMFRHGLAVHLLKQGVPIEVISARLGHSSTKTTMMYYLVITDEMQSWFLKDVPMR